FRQLLPRRAAPPTRGCTSPQYEHYTSSTTPQAFARLNIGAALAQAVWTVRDHTALNVHAHRGVAVREFALKHGHGAADYLLFFDQEAVGAVEAKKEGTSLKGVEVQTEKCSVGLPPERVGADPAPIIDRSTN